ncbi:MAG: hypothetical protein JO227_06385 [Acetobacteraceae bacterium]|nr:hypothetical protein [Acetobacteraceae bacterium]
MGETTGGAGSALAAHSRDASVPGQTPASEATSIPPRARPGGESDFLVRAASQLNEIVRQQPIASMAASFAIGLLISKTWSRR